LALQGTLDTFSLPDVLRLLATTSKTGRLRIEGDRGQGSVWLDAGGVVDAVADRAVEGTPTDEVVFELLRFDSGSFAFDTDDRAAGGQRPEAVEDILRRATNLLSEWSELEAVVPSLAHQVTLAADLSADEVTIDADRWRSVVAVASGRTVGELASELGLTELGVSRAVRDLVELGVVDVESPGTAERRLPEPPPPPRRAPEPVTGEVVVPEPLEHQRAGWLKERTAENPVVSPRAAAGTTNGQVRRDDRPSHPAPAAPAGPELPSRLGTPRPPRPAGPPAGGAPSRGDVPPPPTARAKDAGRPPARTNDAPRPPASPRSTDDTGRMAVVRPGDTGTSPAVRPDAERRPPEGRSEADRRGQAPAERRRAARPPSEAPRPPGRSGGDAGRVPPPAPPSPLGADRNGAGHGPRRDLGSSSPVNGSPFDNGRLGPAPLGGDTGQIRPVGPSSLPPDLHWAADDLSNTGPVGPVTGPVSSPFSGLSSLGPPRGAAGMPPMPAMPPMPDNTGEIAPHVAAMSPEARSAVQATVGNSGGSAGGSRLAPGDDAAQRGRLISFLSTVR
jgi:Domain of unknown function (DUF4388)